MTGRTVSRRARKRRKGDGIERRFVDHRHDYAKLLNAADKARNARRKHGVGRPPLVNLERMGRTVNIVWWEL